MVYFQLTCSVYVKQNITLEGSFEILSKYISFSLYENDSSSIHQKKGFKYYVFDGFYPRESSKIYKQGNTYTFNIRSLDESLINQLQISLRQNINNPYLQVLSTYKKNIKQFFIAELQSVTPTIITTTPNTYWTMQESGDIMQLQRQLHDNAEKKYKSFFDASINIQQNFIQMIEILNQKPQNIIIHKDGKAIRLFGNKFRILPNEDESSQKLAFVAFACGLGEKNSYGAGFMLGKGMR